MHSENLFCETNGTTNDDIAQVKAACLAWEATNKETRLLQQTFPDKVWLHIFDKILDPDILFQLSESTFLWSKLLYPRRTEYLFSKVLRVLVATNSPCQLGYRDILKCRQVCKSFKIGADRLLENVPGIENPQFQKYAYRQCVDDFASPTTFKLYEWHKFVLVMADTQKANGQSAEYCRKNFMLYSASNIFPSRRISINESCFPNFPSAAFWKEQQRSIGRHFLKTVGHNFWIADISLVDLFNGGNCSCFEFICSQVRLLPNLKSLKIRGTHCEENDRSHLPVVRFINSLFPTLRNLQVLNLYETPKCLPNSILVANPHIKVLIIHTVDCDSLDLPELPCLHTLSVYFADATNDFRLPQLPSLKKLRIGFDSNGEKMQWSTIFEKLEQYKETLSELFLSFPYIYSENDMPCTVTEIWRTSAKPLNLPNIKTLELQIQGSIDCCCPDFLLGLQSLESLRLDLFYYGEGRRRVGDSVIIFPLLSPQFSEQTNIWRLIPTLKELEIDSLTVITNAVNRIRTKTLHYHRPSCHVSNLLE